MIDHFAELGLPRAAWMDANEIKSRHHLLMASCHPDKSQGDAERATRLNEARRILEKPGARLRHLLDLEFPDFTSHQKPQPDWDLFSRIGDAAKLAANSAAAQASSTSPLARAVAGTQCKEARVRLVALQKELEQREMDLEQQTQSLPTNDPLVLSRLAEEWTFLSRWESVIHDARSAL